MVKSVKSFVKIGSCLQVSPFLFILLKFPAPPPPLRLFRPPTYFILPNVPTLGLLGPSPFIRDPRVQL